MNDLLEEFLIDGLGRGWSAGSVRVYRWHLVRFVRWLADHQVSDPPGLTRGLLRAWSASLAAWAPSTRKGAVTAIRAFVTWLGEEELVSAELARALKLPRVPRRVQRTLLGDEVAALLVMAAVPAVRGLTAEVARVVAARNVALVALLYDSMIRAAELCALRVEDVDLGRGMCVVRRGKGGRGRLAPFGARTAGLLRDWLAVRPAGGPALFVALGGFRPGSALTPCGLRIVLKRLGERAGVAGVSPHAFRRGGAVAATLNGAPSRLVQVWAGWSNIEMIEVYTRQLEGSAAAVAGFGGWSPVESAR